MNVFLIPSWYPSSTSPLAGVFTQEQAEAIAELAQDTQIIVSKWGHFDGILNAMRPWLWPKRLLWWLRQPRNAICFNKGVIEVCNPKISWSERLPFGGARQLIGVNRRNFNLAQKKFGKIDLIHAHVSYPGGYIASLLAKQHGIPYVLTEHMSPFPFPNLMRSGIPVPEISKAFNESAASIAVSPSLADRIESFGYPRPNVIPNVVDERNFTPGHSSSDKFIFFTLCGITEQKGIDHLLEAIALWNPPANKFEFRIGGEGPMKAIYQAKAKGLGIADRVLWLGAVSRDQAPILFRDCHIFVLPSRHETFGVVYAEAIACGKPIIATRCGGPESIVNEENGQLVDVADVTGLAHAMHSMANDWHNYKPDRIRVSFEQRFSRQAVVKQLLGLYQQVLRGK